MYLGKGPPPGFFEGNDPIETSVRVSDEGYESVVVNELDIIAYSLVMAVVVLIITVVCVFCREERDGTVSANMMMCVNIYLLVAVLFLFRTTSSISHTFMLDTDITGHLFRLE